ncbi:alkaline-phosphatase-like protein [Mycena epipterygia]|nr:alkaline-phosphatase-like protein [Mycena epipterygia]
MKSIAFAVFAAFLNIVSVQAASAKDGPNVVFIMADDQDKLLNSLDYMPNVKAELTNKGVFYDRHYCTIALCCPSRVSLLTGRAAHNTNVTDVAPPYGGYPKFVQEGLNSNSLPVWLQAAGYNTYYAGKLMNGHSTANYDAPFVNGFNSSSFLLDPGMYVYLNSTWQTDSGVPENFPGEHILDINSETAYAYVDDAVKKDVPFFITIAPIAPHAQFIGSGLETITSMPVPQAKWNSSFLDEKVPRTANFNPDVVSLPVGGSWISELPQLDQATIDYNDAFYVARLQLVAGIDEMVGNIISRLDAAGLLESTYIVYTADNGYHIGQHRLQPGKSCPIEEDHLVPLIIRGPGVPAAKVVETVTTHTDLAPTFIQMLGLDLRPEFDGAPIPVTANQISAARNDASAAEHIDMEYWGFLIAHATKATLDLSTCKITPTNLLFYTVWCDNSHELYVDQYQMNNLLASSNLDPTSSLGLRTVPSSTARASSVTDDIPHLTSRLDALMMVLKSCKTNACRKPWNVLHPQGNVQNLADALDSQYDDFYASQPKVSFSECSPGYIITAEGPQDAIPFSG